MVRVRSAVQSRPLAQFGILINMKTAIILHGMPSKEGYYSKDRDAQSNSHWFPWLQHELLLRDILTQTPELPVPYRPVYEDWKKIFERFEINENTILVGHSCGGGFLVRWLSESGIRVGKVILVAPWIDPDGELETDMFDFDLDKDNLEKQNITIFSSEDDETDVNKSVEYIVSLVSDIDHKKYKNKGHFTFKDMNTREFPELLEAVLG